MSGTGAAAGASKKRPSNAATAPASGITSIKSKKPKLDAAAEALLKQVFATQDALSPAEKDALAHRAGVNAAVVQKLFSSLSESVATMVARSVDKVPAFRHGAGPSGPREDGDNERQRVGAEAAAHVAAGLVARATALRGAGAAMVSPFLDPHSCGVRDAEAAEQIAAVAMASADAKGASFQTQLQLAQALQATVDAGALAALREHRRLPGALATIAARAIKHRQTTLLLRLLRVMCMLRVAPHALDRKVREQLRLLRIDTHPAVAAAAKELTKDWAAEAAVVPQPAPQPAAVAAPKAAAPPISKPPHAASHASASAPKVVVSKAPPAAATAAAAAPVVPAAASGPAVPPVKKHVVRKVVSVAGMKPHRPPAPTSAPVAPCAGPAPPPPQPKMKSPPKEKQQERATDSQPALDTDPLLAALQPEPQPAHPQQWSVLPGAIAFRKPERNDTALDLIDKDANPMDHREIKPLPLPELRAAATRPPLDVPFVPTLREEFWEQNGDMVAKGVRDVKYVKL